MNYKTIITSFEASQNDIENKISVLKEAFLNEERFWICFEKFSSELFLNAKAMNLLADGLQLVDNSERIKQFDLQDIKEIYKLLVRFYPNDIKFHVDLISFVYNVLDDEEETEILINDAMLLITENQNYLKDILTSIKGKV